MKKQPPPIGSIMLLVIGLALVIGGAVLSSSGNSESDESNPWGDMDSGVGILIIAIGSVPALIGFIGLIKRT